jgi:hypothetical protein
VIPLYKLRGIEGLRYIAGNKNSSETSTYLLKGWKLETTSMVKPLAHLIKL